MKKLILLLTISLVGTHFASSQVVLYLTGDGANVRRSLDNGATWSNWLTGGSQRAGIAVDQATGTVFVADRGAGPVTQRPLYAYDPTGTLIDTTYFDDSGNFNRRPVGVFTNSNGTYVYINGNTPAGVANRNVGFSTWTGSFSTSLALVNDANTANNNWQGNDMVFASSGGNDYLFLNGTSGVNLRRYGVNPTGTLTAHTAITLSGPTADITDFFFTPSGRLLAINSQGFWLSGASNVTNTSITLTNVLPFGASENLLLGDPGPNGRDFVLIGNTIYAVTNTGFYEFDLDDIAGSISFSGNSYTHGFNTANLHLAYWIIPEPSHVVAVMLVALLIGAVAIRKTWVAKKTQPEPHHFA